ncbi:MAG TPA: biotin/lipoyl-containing protein, partial [Streptomyces sp.]|nr:biotin/lipoyl-containing protein [Streptomyces sp.]
DWQPQTGTLHRLDVPGDVRLDSGVADGDEIGVHYDAMLAKVIAWAPTRREAVRKLAHALERARVHGPTTNRDLLVRSLRHPDFAAGRLDTGFYDRHLHELTAPTDDTAWQVAALAAALADAAGRATTGTSVAGRLGGWRNVPAQAQLKTYRAEHSQEETEVRYRHTRDGLLVEEEDFPGLRLRVLDASPDRVGLEVRGVRRDFEVARYGAGGVHVHVDAPPPLGSHALTALPRLREPETRNEPGSLLAPMPGTVVRVVPGLSVGATVKAGEPLLWLEAMKMEHKVVAPASGTLTAVHAEPGRQVDVGALLAVVTEDPAAQEASQPSTPKESS